jgi:LysR family hydrogen peroxide-inducible transcriptional activator
VPPSPDIRLLPFRGKPPSRSLAMVWRRSSAMGGFLQQLAEQFRKVDPALLRSMRSADAVAAAAPPKPAPRARRAKA